MAWKIIDEKLDYNIWENQDEKGYNFYQILQKELIPNPDDGGYYDLNSAIVLKFGKTKVNLDRYFEERRRI